MAGNPPEQYPAATRSSSRVHLSGAAGFLEFSANLIILPAPSL